MNDGWDAFVENYGTYGGSYPQIEKITQTGSSFVAIRMMNDPWHLKGSQSLQGALDKSGVKKVTIFAASGPTEAKGQISDDGNKIIIDDGMHRLTLTRKLGGRELYGHFLMIAFNNREEVSKGKSSAHAYVILSTIIHRRVFL